MQVEISYHDSPLTLDVPDGSRVYMSACGEPSLSNCEIVMDAVRKPVRSESLADSLRKRPGNAVVIAVSDITRPIPYQTFLPTLLREIEETGVNRQDITILIATGMHRPGTRDEHRYMFGGRIADLYRIVDHDSQRDIATLEGASYSGGPVRINRLFTEADYKITIGLVEPHFMAGFSGGRKTVCPGLSALKTIENFHGYTFLSDAKARAAVLDGNPCHEEAVSVAGVDFSINVVLNRHKQVVKTFAGDIFAAHEKACDYVREHACPPVCGEADVVVTGCGGYPLDATFYQCTKALVTALPCVRKAGMIIASGGCVEGVGSGTYKAMLHKYNNDYHRFIEDIKTSGSIIKDQWQIQMQARFDAWVGWENVYFYTHGIAPAEGAFLGVRTVCVGAGEIAARIQAEIDGLAEQGCSFAVLPEGPYCTPLSAA